MICLSEDEVIGRRLSVVVSRRLNRVNGMASVYGSSELLVSMLLLLLMMLMLLLLLLLLMVMQSLEDDFFLDLTLLNSDLFCFLKSMTLIIIIGPGPKIQNVLLLK